jgi:hypothetical protein
MDGKRTIPLAHQCYRLFFAPQRTVGVLRAEGKLLHPTSTVVHLAERVFEASNASRALTAAYASFSEWLRHLASSTAPTGLNDWNKHK